MYACMCMYIMYVLLNMQVKGENLKMIRPVGEWCSICNHCNNFSAFLYAVHLLSVHWHSDFT